jgi:hypothetical protein
MTQAFGRKQVVSQLPSARPLRSFVSWLSVLYGSMPKLKETYRQIQERNYREIRQRTRDRIRALHEEQGLVVVEDFPDTSTVAAKQSYFVHFLVCVIIILVLVILLLCQSIYLAKRS